MKGTKEANLYKKSKADKSNKKKKRVKKKGK